MSRYQVSNMSAYARMLLEDALHAMRGQARDWDDEGNVVWSDAAGADPEEEVAAAFKELCHHLKMSIDAGRAMEASAKALDCDMKGLQRQFMFEMAREEQRHADDWAWVYGDEEDGE